MNFMIQIFIMLLTCVGNLLAEGKLYYLLIQYLQIEVLNVDQANYNEHNDSLHRQVYKTAYLYLNTF